MSDSHLPPEVRAFLEQAVAKLEHPSWAIQLTARVGKPIEFLQAKLPAPVRSAITVASETALQKALKVAIQTVPPQVGTASLQEAMEKTTKTQRHHTFAAAALGGIGGFFGAAALPVELPATTVLILRAIAEVAAQMGADLDSVETKLECLSIFALGSHSPTDDSSETAYYSIRLGLAYSIQQASAFVAHHSLQELLRAMDRGAAPFLVRLIAQIAARFEIAVSEKILSGAIPIVGSLGAAFLNTVFAEHFAEVARYHFGIRKLEREYGEETVAKWYREIAG